MNSLPFIQGKTCRICGRPLEETAYHTCARCQNEKRYFKHNFVSLSYEDKAKNAVIRLKYSSHPYYAKALAYLMADKLLSSEYFTSFDYITCVPQNSKTARNRGYNQSHLIAKELSALLKIPFIHTLKRTNDGERQATLHHKERWQNVRKCYFCRETHFEGGRVLLVDDVYTTGATVNYCAKLLLQMGFQEVYTATAMIRI